MTMPDDRRLLVAGGEGGSSQPCLKSHRMDFFNNQRTRKAGKNNGLPAKEHYHVKRVP